MPPARQDHQFYTLWNFAFSYSTSLSESVCCKPQELDDLLHVKDNIIIGLFAAGRSLRNYYTG